MNLTRLNVIRHTRNYDAMLRFYRDGLGMIPIETWDAPHNRGTLLTFASLGDGATIEVLDLDNLAQPGVKSANLDIGFNVDDVQAWHDTLVARGVPIARALKVNPWSSVSFGVDDPDGLRLWFSQWEAADETA